MTIREIVREQIRATKKECKEIASDADQTLRDQSPEVAVRRFYPALNRIIESNATYANMIIGHGSPNLLQQAFLGIPVLIDLYDTKDRRTFYYRYKMTPEQMASEVRHKRIVPMANADDFDKWPDHVLKVLEPVILTGRVQYAHHRTTSFQRFFAGDLSKILENGQRLFNEYFQPSEHETQKLYRVLRIEKYENPNEAYKRVIIGRWRNIISLKPSLQEPMWRLFEELRDRPTEVRARILNGVKSVVSGGVSAARGGVFRGGARQAKEIADLKRWSRVSEEMAGIVDVDLPHDFWTKEITSFLEKKATVIPSGLTYPRYRELIEQREWKDFSSRLSRLLSRLPTEQSDFSQAAWEQVMEDYDRTMSSYRRVEKYWLPILSLVPGGVSSVVVRPIVRVVDGVKTWQKPGGALAQIVWRARWNKWPSPLR